jgi:DNA adenine methylase
MKPLFMWAGGKTKMIKKYGDILPESFDSYVEPFLGAGAMFVWAYKRNPDATFVLNDYNESIMAIYKAIKDDVHAFTARMDELSSEYLPLIKEDPDKIKRKTLEKKLEKDWAKLYSLFPCRRYLYFKLRQEHAFEYDKWTSTEEAASLYFLMKTGFNGIWQVNKNTDGRFGTPSGLLNQKDKVYDKDNVMEWHTALQGCTLMAGDFAQTLGKVESGAYVFLDPPYRGSFTQYGVDFDDKMQNRVIDYLNKSASKGALTLMSNRDVGDGFFEDRQGDNKLVYFDVTYTAGRRKKNEDGIYEAKKAREILMIGN